jgi:septal ring-binding cell division protein DamX
MPPATTPPATTLAAKPTPAPVTGGASSLAEGRGLMQRGDLAGAGQAFATHLRRTAAGTFSIQILVACSEDTVQKAVQNVQAQELYVLPVQYKGRNCYRLCWGLYDNQARADSAVSAVPDYFRKGGAAPKVVPTASILP